MDYVAKPVRCASEVINFVYNYVALLSWLRKKKWTDFLTWCNSLYYTTFIALKSLFYHKHDLQAFVTSKFFVDF